MTTFHKNSGVTMVELLIGIFAAAIVLYGISKIFTAATKDFARAESFTQIRSNVDATLDKVAEEFMQAGADLPKTWPCVQPVAGVNNDVTVIANPTGAKHTFAQAISLTVDPRTVKIDIADGFSGSTKVKHLIWNSGAVNDLDLKAYNSGNFVNGVDAVGDSLCFNSNVSFLRGDMVFVPDTFQYYHDASTNTLRIVNKGTTRIYASNVETFHIVFKNAAGVVKTTWADMRVCSLFVQVRATKKERGVAGDGYRRISGSRRFYFRNREF